jgi:endonuclease/exonuclease/phosphatase family metal-dependent hydrolase
MTYNVHSCIGTDAKLSVERVAAVIAECSADVVCLQELDVGRMRSGAMDQAREIATMLEMHFQFHPAISLAEERYGDAVLSRYPLALVRGAALPGLPHRPGLEPRGALWVTMEIDGVSIQLINTHLGLMLKERRAQIEALLGNEWLGHEACRGPIVFCGDLNALPWSRVYRALRRQLRDTQLFHRGGWPKATYPSRIPIFRIDHVFVNSFLEVEGTWVAKGPLARKASDHLPLIVDLVLQV